MKIWTNGKLSPRSTQCTPLHCEMPFGVISLFFARTRLEGGFLEDGINLGFTRVQELLMTRLVNCSVDSLYKSVKFCRISVEIQKICTNFG